jgi:hypothetical protein
MILPVNRMRIDEQLVMRSHIIKDGHLTVSDDDQFLLFEGMQPGHKDMGFYPTRKREKAHCDISNLVVQVIAAVRVYRFRHLTHQAKDDGDIVRCKGPEDILFPTDLPQVEPGRIDILEPAESPCLNQFLELEHRWMIPEEMANHEHALMLYSQCHQLLPNSHGQG